MAQQKTANKANQRQAAKKSRNTNVEVDPKRQKRHTTAQREAAQVEARRRKALQAQLDRETKAKADVESHKAAVAAMRKVASATQN